MPDNKPVEAEEQSAAERALNTYDILETILPYLETRSILRCRTVSKIFRYVVDTSIAVRKCLGLRLATWADAMQDKDYDHQRGIYCSPLLYNHPLHLGALCCVRPYTWIHYAGAREHNTRLAIRYPFRIGNFNTMDWTLVTAMVPNFIRALYLGTPETKSVSIPISWEGAGNNGWQSASRDLKSSKAITPGDVIDGVREWLDEVDVDIRSVSATVEVDIEGKAIYGRGELLL